MKFADLHLDSMHFTMSARCTRWPRSTLPAVEWSIVHMSEGHSVAPYTRHAQQGSSQMDAVALAQIGVGMGRLSPACPARTRQSGSGDQRSAPTPPRPRAGRARC